MTELSCLDTPIAIDNNARKNYSNKDKTFNEAKKLQLSANSVTNESNNDSTKDCTDEDIATVKYSLPKCLTGNQRIISSWIAAKK